MHKSPSLHSPPAAARTSRMCRRTCGYKPYGPEPKCMRDEVLSRRPCWDACSAPVLRGSLDCGPVVDGAVDWLSSLFPHRVAGLADDAPHCLEVSPELGVRGEHEPDKTGAVGRCHGGAVEGAVQRALALD